MADDYGGTGGGQSSPVIDKLDPLFTDIADFLGELAGNEAAHALLVEERTDAHEKSVEDDSKYSCPLGDFTFPGTYGFTVQSRFLHTVGQAPGDRERDLQEEVTAAWQNAYDEWTTGSPESGYMTLSQNVWEPDPVAMEGAARDLSFLAQWLHEQVAGAGWVATDDKAAPEWLVELEKGWPATSKGPESFYAFWDDVNDKCAHYRDAAARLTATSAQVFAVVNDCQTNAVDLAKKTKARVKEALKQWQQWGDDSGTWPTGEMEDSALPEILGAASLATGAISLYGPAAAVAGPISVGAGLLSYAVPAEMAEVEALKAATATGIDQGLVEALNTLDSTLEKALSSLQTEPPKDALGTGTEGFSEYTARVAGDRKDWSPPEVSL